jgi:hypothetical protein
MTATVFMASIINTITSTSNKSEEFATEVRRKLITDLREESDLMFWKSVIVATEDGRITSAYSATKVAIQKIFGSGILESNKRHRPSRQFAEDHLIRPILDQSLTYNVAATSSNEDPNTPGATMLSVPRGFESSILEPSAVFQLPPPPEEISSIPLNVQLLLAIFVREGLTEAAGKLFLEAWAEECWSSAPDAIFKPGVNRQSLGLEQFSSKEQLQSILKVKL